MNDSQKRLSVPLFIRVLMALAVSSIALVSTTSYLADRGARSIANDGVRTLAGKVTVLTSVNLAGAVRFHKSDEIERRLLEMRNSGLDSFVAATVTDAEGQILSEVSAIEGLDLSDLSAAARQVAESGEPVSGPNGLLQAVPTYFGPEDDIVGVVATLWSTERMEKRLAFERGKQLTYAAIILVVSLIISAIFTAYSVTRPVKQIISRTGQLADGDLASDVPCTSNRSEIGLVARAIETLRQKLSENETTRRDAEIVSAGFGASSTAMIMTDANLNITHFNAAFRSMADEHLKNIRSEVPHFNPDTLIGTCIDVFHEKPESIRGKIESASYPLLAKLQMGDAVMVLTINAVRNDEGMNVGYLVEWQEATEQQKTRAIFEALEAAQLRADFASDGHFVSCNAAFETSFGIQSGILSTVRAAEVFRTEDGESLAQKLVKPGAIIGRFSAAVSGTKRLLDGSLSPTTNALGRVNGHVFLGRDITDAEAKLAATAAENQRMQAEQAGVVETLRSALNALSAGDLSVRIDQTFGGEYENLRRDFNSALQSLDDALQDILESAASILAESGNISGAADDLSQRTEQQAATLEKTAAAVSQLTASVASAAEGARNANNVVDSARSNAEASGKVVQEAVEAMGKIESSSDQISRIISVIDDIAFQTNLLALNAGVEAARAGDAGRGFAVVASEVRGLAQRSSDAAREITDLISTSGDHVKQGVTLVGRAGDALNEIVKSVSGIAEHVSSIATSAREQSTGLDEINVAMNRLDQVTQKNVAMFEETTAASHTLTREANTLVSVTGNFRTTTRRSPAKPSANASGSTEPGVAPQPKKELSPPKHADAKHAPKSAPSAVGNLAVAVSSNTEDWEEF